MKTTKRALAAMIRDADGLQVSAIFEALTAHGLIADCGNCLKPVHPHFDDADNAIIELD